jgi:uncharacterized membrane protein YkvA (DUF1232 family)
MSERSDEFEMSAEDLSESMREASVAGGSMSEESALRFYDRMRENIRRYLERKGKLAGATGEYLLLAPDVFVLLWRLVNDSRVDSKNKVMLGTGIAYFLFPLDLMPEAFLGPVGYLDDLVFGVYLLNRLLTSVDASVLKQHWSGNQDLLAVIRNVLAAADNLVGSNMLARLKKIMK